MNTAARDLHTTDKTKCQIMSHLERKGSDKTPVNMIY